MKDSILMAIESLCADIATDTDAEENRKRAASIAALAISGFYSPMTRRTKQRKPRANQSLPMQKSNMPKSGDRFTYNGMSFVILGEEQGGVLAIQKKPLRKELAFDTDDYNDWRQSSIRKHLNERYIKKFNKDDLLPFHSDLTTDDGLKGYGVSEDYIFLLSCDLYRKYREYIPRYNKKVWLITAWSYEGYATNVKEVNVDGSLCSCPAYAERGIIPACLFKYEVLKNNNR